MWTFMTFILAVFFLALIMRVLAQPDEDSCDYIDEMEYDSYPPLYPTDVTHMFG